ncbi:MAG: class II aldolase/adducin family protein [Treponemataceae bacterium]|nr:class II aldolase/adducin family protein [Treponemataceae bacterium]
MTIEEIKESVAETGRILLKKKLVARTWGNFSCKIDETHFAITPSGLGYENLEAKDIPIFDMVNETYEGPVKPSSEKRIHAAAYRTYPDVNFVVHTHQNYGTAIGLVGTDELKMTDEEKELLGPIAIASYGLPGTKKLKKGVEKALESGSKTILMIHHGAVILGKDREDAIHKSEVLEEVCKRAFDEKVIAVGEQGAKADENFCKSLENNLGSNFMYHKIISTPLMIELADKGSFKAQLDDMSQMLGSTLRAVDADEKKIFKVLSKQDAVLVKNVGLIVKSDSDIDDIAALEVLIEKAGLARLYTHACGKKIKLSGFDCALMHFVFKMKYSKQKNKNASSDDDTEGARNKGKDKNEKKAEGIRILKFFLFSTSAGIIEILSETILEKCLPWAKMTENTEIKYWVSYLIALILSVIWNFTFNRKFTFKSATNVPIAMLKVFAFYLVFTPATTFLQKFLCSFDWGAVDAAKGQITTGINMAINLTTEYVYDRFFVFRNSIDTNTGAKKDK